MVEIQESAFPPAYDDTKHATLFLRCVIYLKISFVLAGSGGALL